MRAGVGPAKRRGTFDRELPDMRADLHFILALHSGLDETPVVTLALANLGRQFKMENRASARPRRHPNPAAVALDDRTADRETHSHATRLGRKKEVEDTIDVGWINSRPSIFDRHMHEIRFAGLRLYIEHARPQ